MFTTLAFTITGGMLAVLATARVEQIAWKFLRLVGLLTLAVCAVPAVAIVRREGWATPAVLAVLAATASSVLVVIAPVAPRTPVFLRSVAALGGLAGLLAAAMTAQASFQASHPDARAFAGAMLWTAQGLSGLLLGSITLAWLLGHAYLTATSMTIAPLRHFSRMLSWTAATRLAFLLGSLALAWATGGTSIFARLGDAWLIAFLRIGVGLLGIAAFAYMVADCVRLRSTQSATGILYFGSVMAYVGELASQQLIFEIGWPL